MYDSRIGADHGVPHTVGDVWVDDNANGTDGRCRRLLCGGGAVLSTRRGAEEQKKKTALTSGKVISAKPNILRLYYKMGMERMQ